MPKNIILCSDGTGNIDIKGRGTNVFKLFEAVDLNGHRTDPALDTQLAFYDDGVGTRGNVLVRLIGGAAGYGLKRNVKELYKELSRVYDEGDRIYLFGFSRGAFTVRTLAGMISACGVLVGEEFNSAQALRNAVEAAYDAYRSQYHSVLTRLIGRLRGWPGGADAIAAFHQRYRAHHDVPIRFIGVWDTVDAVGMPFDLTRQVNRWIYQFKFPTQTLGPRVQDAFQALSIDDPRLAFEPVLWHGPDTRIRQVWFSGVHSNVGGGYPKQGMSLVALDWMLAQADACGLRLQQTDRDLFRGHATVDDLLYDPRANSGIFYRWAPRDIQKLCEGHGIHPSIHLSVVERVAHATDDYAPGNIPPGCTVAYTPVDVKDPLKIAKDGMLQARASAAERALNSALAGHYLLSHVRAEVELGVRSYWAFMCAWALLLLAPVLAAAGRLAYGFWARLGQGFYMAAVLSVISAVIGFLLAWLWSSRADAAMEDCFTLFWQKHQKELRAALKQSKRELKGEPAQ